MNKNEIIDALVLSYPMYADWMGCNKQFLDNPNYGYFCVKAQWEKSAAVFLTELSANGKKSSYDALWNELMDKVNKHVKNYNKCLQNSGGVY